MLWAERIGTTKAGGLERVWNVRQAAQEGSEARAPQIMGRKAEAGSGGTHCCGRAPLKPQGLSRLQLLPGPLVESKSHKADQRAAGRAEDTWRSASPHTYSELAGGVHREARACAEPSVMTHSP